MYDSHTHLTSQELINSLDKILSSFKNAGGVGILNVAFDLDSNFKVLEVSKDKSLSSKVKIFPSLGLHPENFYSNAQIEKPITDLNQVSKSLTMIYELIERNRRDVYAIGETGLDYYQVINDEELTLSQKEEQVEVQRYAFREHVKWSLKMNLPLTIHIRDNKGSDDCVKDALKIVCETGKGLVKGSFHSYTGSKKYLEDILNLGFMVGYNGIITYASGEDVRELLIETPLDSILIESDAPFLPPQEKRSSKDKNRFKYGEPVDLVEIISKVSLLKERSEEEISQITGENFKKLFNIDE